MSDITVYQAREIITINPKQASATHVAVQQGRILGVGDLDSVSHWGEYQLNTDFANKVIMPGFVEGHSHMLEGGVWRYIYVGYFDRRGPDGVLHKGLTSIESVIERLQNAEAELADPNEALVAWGFDPIYFDNKRMVKADLDQVSSSKPVVVIHASLHLVNCNSFVLDASGVDRDSEIEGVAKDVDGEPTGELIEFTGMFIAFRQAKINMAKESATDEAMWRFAKVAQLAGVTTATDLHSDLSETTVANYCRVTAEEEYPLRLVTAFGGTIMPLDKGLARIKELPQHSTDKARFGLVKLVPDGSIQGFSARLKWPGYYNGAANGLWNLAPDQINEYVSAYHAAGCQLHIHANGDETSEVCIKAVAKALQENPRSDHRHTLQHCQMATRAQMAKMKNLGIGVNLFTNHLYYWGDAHYSTTLGPERAEAMDACASALDYQVPLAIHSDAPVTPIGPLFTAWCAVNRLTAEGRVLGEAEKISVSQALQAITLGAAYSLNMDDEIGSIECGKRADFAILEQSPYEVAPKQLKDIEVWGTVVGGKIFAAPTLPQ